MITDKKIVVIGSGVSGVGAVKLLEAAGAVPTLYDSNEKLTEAEVRKRLPEGSKCKVVLGEILFLEEGARLCFGNPKTPRSTMRAENFCSQRSQKVSVPTVISI